MPRCNMGAAKLAHMIPMSRLAAAVLPIAFLVTPACAQNEQQKQEVSAAETKKLADAVQQQLAAEHIAVDAKAQTITIGAVMNQPPDPIEYLLIHKKGKRHEAVFITGSKPSVLNAAFLLLGFAPGRNATAKEKNPPPSLEEIEKGADPMIITPPQGQQFWITVRWKDAAGKPVEYCVEDLLVDLQAEDVVKDNEWIYLGGRMAQLYKNEPEVFVADFEGNLISSCYMSPDNHLATMRHERARSDQNWWITRKCPEPGTEVEIVFWKQKPKLVVEREQRLKDEAAKKAAEGKDEAKKDEGKKDEGPGKESAAARR
jgi:hypothetical protein